MNFVLLVTNQRYFSWSLSIVYCLGVLYSLFIAICGQLNFISTTLLDYIVLENESGLVENERKNWNEEER